MPVVANLNSDLPAEQSPVAQSSGTVAFTVIDTVKVIEHAVRRAGKNATVLTPEQLDSAYDNLYLILTSMVNRGVNLWCVERSLLGLVPGQKTIALPAGTVNILDVAYRSVTALAATWTNVAAMKSAVLASASTVRSVGMLVQTPGNYRFAYEYKTATGVWTTLKTLNVNTGTEKWIWVDIDVPREGTEFRIRETGAVAFFAAAYVLAQDFTEQVMQPYNRDDYSAVSDKNIAGKPYNYLYEKQINPIMTLYPVPSNQQDCLVVTRQRQVQDVGSLLAKLEIPERWFECIIWMLAKNMAYELPEVPAERMTLCDQQAQNALREAELGESDGAPLRILPNISGYTA